MAIHASILAWRIPRTEEPGGLCMVHRVTELDMPEVDLAHTHTSDQSLFYNLS